MSRGGNTLYVTGFGPGTRAKDLAREFERYGRLVRCDIPAPRTQTSRLFAFVEYEDRHDADDAYHEMHGKRIGRDGRDDLVKIEWARTPPSASWRFDRPDRSDRGGRRARSPSPRNRRDYSPRRDDRDRRDRDRDYDRDRDHDRDRRHRSRSPDQRDRDRDRERERERERDRDRDYRDDRDDRDRRDNGVVADRKGDTPPPVHDDLDVAE